MINLEWLETFELGNPEIGNDHKELLAAMKRIAAAAVVEDFDLCGQLLDELVVQSEAHFRREEELLENAGYRFVDFHREYHSALIARAEEMKKICKGVKSRGNFKACCDEMMSFLVDDIIGGDLNFKSFLQEKGLTD